ncbi:hypothetical protein JST97_17690 [bacterium]|nr:hypothetical protein [bacterium]
MKNYRNFITGGTAFAFLVVASTGLTFEFLFKTHLLEKIHTWVGITMVGLVSLHVFQNFKSLRHHLARPRTYAMLLPILVIAAFFAASPEPTKSKTNPKQVLARLSGAKIADLSKVFNREPAAIVQAMQKDGLRVSGAEQSLQSLGEANQRPPESLLSYFLQ